MEQIAQWTMLVLFILSGGINIGKHGEKKPDLATRYDFRMYLIHLAISMLLLIAGGYFDKL